MTTSNELDDQSSSDGKLRVAFNDKIKKHKFEQFSLLLYDADTCDPIQKEYLKMILLKDHKSLLNWYNYIDFSMKKFSSRKLQLQRLVNKAIECVDDILYINDIMYLTLHLHCTQLKKDDNEVLKYYKDVMYKKNVGLKIASMYVTWSNIELRCSNNTAKAIDILQKGISNQAEPLKLIMASLESLSPLFTNSIVTFNKQKVSNSMDSDDDDDDVTEVISQTKKPDFNIPTESATCISEVPEPIVKRGLSSSSSSSSSSDTCLTKPSPSCGDFVGCKRIASGPTFFDFSVSDDDNDDKDTEIIPTIKELVGISTAVSESNKENIVASTRSTRSTNKVVVSASTERQKKSKDTVALSKYVDDKLLNFSPSKWKLRNSSKTDVTVKAEAAAVLEIICNAEKQNNKKARSNSSVSSRNNNNDSSGSSSKCDESDIQQETAVASIASTIVRPRLSISDDDNSSFDISICDITTKLPVAPAVLVPTPTRTSKKRGTSKDNGIVAAATGSDSIDTSCKKKRVSFARNAPGALIVDPKEVIINAVPSSGSSSAGASSEMNSSSSSSSRSSSSSSSNSKLSNISLNGTMYTKLNVLGRGGSSCVYRVMADDGTLFAYKRVDIRGNDNDNDAVIESYINEINLLKSLSGSQQIIELIAAEVNRDDMYIAMVMEIGDVDLSKALLQQQKIATQLYADINPFFVRLIWQQMLEAVDYIHEHRIVHGDLKPANFVFVKNHLKLIDFGIAKAFTSDTTNIYRDSQIGTINYMAPEAIAPNDIDEANNGRMKLGRSSDIWSLGCILYQMVFGRPPFAALNTIQKLACIPNPNYSIQYPAHNDTDAVDTIKQCLVRNHKERAVIRGPGGLLDNHKFLALSRHDDRASTSSSTVTANAKDKLAADDEDGDDDDKTTEVIPPDTTGTACSPGNFSYNEVETMISYVLKNRNMQPDNLAKEVYSLLLSRNIRKLELTKPLDVHTESSKIVSTRFNASQVAVNNENIPPVAAITAKINGTSHKSKVGQSPLTTNNRQPLKPLPSTLLEQLHNQQTNLQSVTNSKSIKWMKPKGDSPEKNDIRAAMERKLCDMRKFLNADDCDEGEDNTFYNDFSFSEHL